MNNDNDKNRLFVARCALVLLVAGPLVPILIAPWKKGLGFEEALPYVLAFVITTEVLALIPGIMGRRHLSGKIGMFGATVLLALALACLVFSYPQPPRAPVHTTAAQPIGGDGHGTTGT